MEGLSVGQSSTDAPVEVETVDANKNIGVKRRLKSKRGL